MCSSSGFSFSRGCLAVSLASYHAAAGGFLRHGVTEHRRGGVCLNARFIRDNFEYPWKRNRRTLSGEEDDDQERPKAKEVKKEQPDCQRPRCFAVPILETDSNKHWECILKKMTSISYVKQHLLRRHTLTFTVTELCDHSWMRGRTMSTSYELRCFRDESVKFEGITHDQSRQCRKRSLEPSRRSGSRCGGSCLPNGSRRRGRFYVDFDRAVDLGLKSARLAIGDGVGTLRDTLQSSGLLLRSGGLRVRGLERVLGVGLDAVV